MAHTITPPPAPPDEQAVLELRDEAPKRPFLKLAGERYHFKLKSDLSLEQIARARQVGEKLQTMTDESTPEECAAISAELHEVTGIVMFDMPAEIVAGLTDGECLAIVEGFMRALPTEASPAAPSVTPSPASPASTPASIPSEPS